MTIPDRPSLAGLESKWDATWERDRTYAFDRAKTREQIYAIDTPPPTVSGSLHLGSAFGYVQTDAIARFQRMRGAEVFYPMGWDDNGLPTERRVQNFYGVRCDPSMAHDPSELEGLPSEDGERAISRPSFIELCHRLTQEDEKQFEQTWRDLGLSVDWKLTYATIGDRARRVAQIAFLRNLARGEAYSREAPTVWDVDFRTAVAQAEIEDRETPSAIHRIAFPRVDADEAIEIETTRPELLPACVALVAHPDDERYKPLFGSSVRTPVFGVEVPVVAHRLAAPDKGTGIAMVCTFGDTTDIIWWRELKLPLRVIVGRDGRLRQERPDWLPETSHDVWPELAGKYTKQARKRLVELLRETGAMTQEPRQIVHPVNYFEKGDRPLKIVTSRQWYIRNGAGDEALTEALLARGAAIAWHPEFMHARYEHWVRGLNSDWLISRQRHFGVPFPVWYRLDDAGEPQWEDPIVPQESELPVDPQSQAPPGYTEDQRGVPGGFVADPDVMDTWATSSLSPQIVCGWVDDEDLFARTFPMDLRPQGPEIIRTWLFSTILRSHLEHDAEPWAATFLNGWILDPDRKKMSKSKGQALTPGPLVEEFGADGVRYWALKAAPGADTAIDKAQMKNGRRLATKLLNASRFVLGVASPDDIGGEITQTVDRAMLAHLAGVVKDATAAYGRVEYNQALSIIEASFWQFCDEYIELVKNRAYGEGDGATSARAALATGLSTLHRLLAPFTPFVAEEAWSWWQEGSVHRAPWPGAEELRALAGDVDVAPLHAAAEILTRVHRAKSTAKLSLRTEVARVVVHGDEERLAVVRAVASDVKEAGRVNDLVLQVAEDPSVEVDLGTPAGGGA